MPKLAVQSPSKCCSNAGLFVVFQVLVEGLYQPKGCYRLPQTELAATGPPSSLSAGLVLRVCLTNSTIFSAVTSFSFIRLKISGVVTRIIVKLSCLRYISFMFEKRGMAQIYATKMYNLLPISKLPGPHFSGHNLAGLCWHYMSHYSTELKSWK